VKTVRCSGGATKAGPLGAMSSESRSGPGPGRRVERVRGPTPPGPWRREARGVCDVTEEEERFRVGRVREGEERFGECGWEECSRGRRLGDDGGRVEARGMSMDVPREVPRSENVLDFRRARGK
jgi:hypothetical protein